MAEDINQDMEMEDILSSIKNILEEDQALSSASEKQSDEVQALADADPSMGTTAPEDDVLELSPDMRVDDKVAEINLDAELDEIDVSSDITTDDAEVKVTLGTEDFDSDPFYEESEDLEKNTDVIMENDISPLAETETVSDTLPETISEPEVVSEPLPEIVPEPLSVPVAEPTAPIETVPVPEVKKEPENSATAVEASADSALDVSASIISNFAKLFSREEEPKKEETPITNKQEPIHFIGDGSKTIEDVVASVIKQIIGVEVAEHWKEGLDYNNLAHQEIAKQTKEWLDINLPSVVEKIVKQEIERVMAKVGNNQ